MTLRRFSLLALSVLFIAPCPLHGRVTASDGPVRRAEWNSNMAAVVEEARLKRIPMLLVLENQGCSYCTRLKDALDGVAFDLWRRDRNILIAYVFNPRRQSKKISPQSVRKTIPFFKANRSQNMPMVYVWWSKPDGSETGRAFTGRRDAMGGESHDFLSMEFISAIDKVLADYLSQGFHRTLDQILKDCPKKIDIADSSSGGTVSIEPASGLLTEGSKVTLKAHAGKKYVFLEWTGPDGRSCGHHEELIVTGSMQEGTYAAHFKSISDILPPDPTPACSTISIQAGETFKHMVPINADSLPVTFKHDKLPPNVRFDSCHGILEGTTKRVGTNIINIAILGSDINRTTATNQVILIVNPKSPHRQHRIKNK